MLSHKESRSSWTSRNRPGLSPADSPNLDLDVTTSALARSASKEQALFADTYT